MRILILTAAYPPDPGGVATNVADLAHGLVQRHHTVYVVTLNKDENHKQDGSGSLKIWKRPRRLAPEFDGRRVFCEEILKFLLQKWHEIRPDIVHVHDLDSLFVAWLLRCAHAKPIVMTVHRAPSAWRKGRHLEVPKDTFLEAMRIHDVLAGIVVPSQASAQVLREQGFGKGEGISEVKVIPHGISPFLHGVTDDPDVIEFLGDQDSRLLVACPSRADEHKDVETFLEAAGLLLKAESNLSLLFLIGSDASDRFHAKLKQRAMNLGLNEGAQILFRKFHYKEMATVYRRAKVCVVPSRHESFGLTVLEAFMFGVPVIAANTSALKEIITNQQNGLLFTDGNQHELASQIARVLTDQSLRENLCEHGRHALRPEGPYSAATMVEQYERFYERILLR